MPKNHRRVTYHYCRTQYHKIAKLLLNLPNIAEYCRGTQEEEAFMSDATVAKKPRETDDVPVPPTLRKSL